MKEKVLFAFTIFCGGLIITLGSASLPAPVPVEPGGCSSMNYCAKVWNPNTEEWQYRQNKGLQEYPWYDCCGQDCDEEDQGKDKVEELPI